MSASFIVVGMKQHGKELRKFLGSNVTWLSKQSPIPMLVIPEEAAFKLPKTIALASDVTNESQIHLLDPLKKIAETYNSKLFVVRVITNAMDETSERLMRYERLEWLLTSLHPYFEFPKDNNVTKAMNKFVDKHSVDLVAVIPHEHSLIEKIFARSVTKSLVFHTHVPLLILPEDKIERIERAAYVSSAFAGAN